MFQILEVQYPFLPHLPYKSILAYIYIKVLGLQVCSHLFMLLCKIKEAIWQVLGHQL